MKAITALFDILPGWIWAAIVAAAMAVNCSTSHRLDSERGAHAQTKTDHANTKAEFSEYRAAAARTALILSEKNRATEQQLEDEKTANTQLAQQALDAVMHAASVDLAARRRVQDAARDAADAARTRCAAAGAPGYSTPGHDPIGVLADVLGRADARAGELAAVADASRVRGLTCERAYDAARQALNG